MSKKKIAKAKAGSGKKGKAASKAKAQKPEDVDDEIEDVPAEKTRSRADKKEKAPAKGRGRPPLDEEPEDAADVEEVVEPPLPAEPEPPAVVLDENAIALIIKKIKGRKSITYAEFNDLLPEEAIDPKEIVEVFTRLAYVGITVMEATVEAAVEIDE